MATLMQTFDYICSTDGDKTAFYTTICAAASSAVSTSACTTTSTTGTAKQSRTRTVAVGFSELNENIKLIASELHHRHGIRRNRPTRQKSKVPSSDLDLNLLSVDHIKEKCQPNVLIVSNQPSPGEAAAVMACTKLHIPFVPLALDGSHRTSDTRVKLILDEVKPAVAIVILCIPEEEVSEEGSSNEDDWEIRPALSHQEIDVDSHPSIIKLNRLGVHRIVLVKGQDGSVIGPMAGLQAEIKIPSPPMEEDGLDPMYILYTSGSTAKPKAVVQSYLGLWNRIQWQWDTFPFVQQMRRQHGLKETMQLLIQDGIVEEDDSNDECEIDDIVLRRTSLSFVDSIVEIFGPLLAGVPLWCPLRLHFDGQDTTNSRGFGLSQMLDMAMENGLHITRMTCLPSQLGQALRIQKEGGRCDAKNWTTVLDFIIVSGEPCPSSLPILFEDSMSKKRPMLVNLYGQTESSGDVLCLVVSSGVGSQELGSIARFPNADDYIWNRIKPQEPSTRGAKDRSFLQNFQQSLVPCGQAIQGHKFMIKPLEESARLDTSTEFGRLFVSGPGLALGYFNNEKEMTENFILQQDKDENDIWLNTMDLAFRDDKSSSIVVVGRAPKDPNDGGSQSSAMGCSLSMGKLNGVMIHIAEMEDAFNAAFKQILVRERIASEKYIAESFGVLFSDESNNGEIKSAVFCSIGTLPQTNFPKIYNRTNQRVLEASLVHFQDSDFTFQEVAVDARSLILDTNHPVMVPHYVLLLEELPKNGAAGKVDRSLLAKIASDYIAHEQAIGSFKKRTNENEYANNENALSLSDIIGVYSHILRHDVDGIKNGSLKIFSELGGDSMMAINATHQILAMAREKRLELLDDQVITPVDLMHSSIQAVYDILVSGRQSIPSVIKKQRTDGQTDNGNDFDDLPNTILYSTGKDTSSSCCLLSKIWKAPLLMCIDSAPIALKRGEKTILVAASQGGDIAMIEPDSGEILHRTMVQGKIEGDLNYLHPTTTTSIIGDDDEDGDDDTETIVFIPSYESRQRKGFLTALRVNFNTNELENLWHYETHGEVKSKPCVCTSTYEYVSKTTRIKESQSVDDHVKRVCRCDIVMVASYGGTLSCLDARTGKLLDEHNDLGGAIHADPVVIRSSERGQEWNEHTKLNVRVVVASCSWKGRISYFNLRCCCNDSSEEYSLVKLWSVDLWTPIYAPPKHMAIEGCNINIHENDNNNDINVDVSSTCSIVIFGVDGSVRSLDCNSNGDELWQVLPTTHHDDDCPSSISTTSSSRPIFTPCCVFRSHYVVYGSYDGRVRCVDVRDGTIQWKSMDLESPIVAKPIYVRGCETENDCADDDDDDGRLIVVTTSGNIRVLHASTGTAVVVPIPSPDNNATSDELQLQLQSLRLDGEVFCNPLLHLDLAGCLYVGCRDSHLYKFCLRWMEY